jgi:hypothetical protein
MPQVTVSAPTRKGLRPLAGDGDAGPTGSLHLTAAGLDPPATNKCSPPRCAPAGVLARVHRVRLARRPPIAEQDYGVPAALRH